MTPESPIHTRPFAQVDVFSPDPLGGNPLAVVLDSSGLSTMRMQQFANWTNLSETTFLLPPADPRADYRVRIFTPTEEFPFAGHPTLGSAHAWLEAGGTPRQEGTLIQESAAGLVKIKTGDGGRLAFAAPALTRFEPVAEDELDRVAAGLGLPREALLDAAWLVNGPEWIGVLLDSAARVLAIRPNYPEMAGLAVGVIGPHPSGAATEFEVRTFISDDLPCEDPVTGSFNAGAAQWLIGSGRAPSAYTAAQGPSGSEAADRSALGNRSAAPRSELHKPERFGQREASNGPSPQRTRTAKDPATVTAAGSFSAVPARRPGFQPAGPASSPA